MVMSYEGANELVPKKKYDKTKNINRVVQGAKKKHIRSWRGE
jgi:hypothetical protein